MYRYVCSIVLITSPWHWLMHFYWPVTNARLLPHDRAYCRGTFCDHAWCMGAYPDCACCTGTTWLIAFNPINSISYHTLLWFHPGLVGPYLLHLLKPSRGVLHWPFLYPNMQPESIPWFSLWTSGTYQPRVVFSCSLQSYPQWDTRLLKLFPS